MPITKLGKIILGNRRAGAPDPQSEESAPATPVRPGSCTETDPRLKQLVKRATRPSAVSLWNVLNRD